MFIKAWGWVVTAAMAIASARAAEPAATFQSIGLLSESTAQVSVTATPSGRVVIGEAWLADVFDAQANAWLPHLVYQGSHWTAGAALLPDGRVLVAGTTSTTATITAEILDPVVSTSTVTGALLSPRYGPSLCATLDGRVLAWAGTAPGTSSSLVATTELYNPSAGAFSTSGSNPPARWNATFTRLADGRFLIVGGSTADGTVQQVAQIYDAVANTTVPTGAIPDFVWQHAAVLLQDGRVLIVGGMYSYLGSVRPSNHAFLYSPGTGQFTPLPAMAYARKLPTATRLPDGKVLIAGGGGDYWTLADRAETFDPATNTFTLGPAMVVPRYGASATALPDGRVLIAGGWDRNDTNGQPVTVVEVYGSDRIFSADFE
jgi:hypothetical protein